MSPWFLIGLIVKPPLHVRCPAPRRANPQAQRDLTRPGDFIAGKIGALRPSHLGIFYPQPGALGRTLGLELACTRVYQVVGYLFRWIKSPAFVADTLNKAAGASYRLARTGSGASSGLTIGTVIGAVVILIASSWHPHRRSIVPFALPSLWVRSPFGGRGWRFRGQRSTREPRLPRNRI